jgi:hypothetical protein
MKKIFFLSQAIVFAFATKAQNNLGVLQTATPGSPLISNGDIRMFKTNPLLTLHGDINSYYPQIIMKTDAPVAPTGVTQNGGFIGIYSPAYYGAGGIHFNTYTAQNKILGIGAFPTGNIATSNDPSVLTFRVTGAVVQSNDIFKVLRNTATQTGYLTEENALTVNKNGNTNFGVNNPAPITTTAFNGTVFNSFYDPKVSIQGGFCQNGLLVRTTGGCSENTYSGYFSNYNAGADVFSNFGMYGESFTTNGTNIGGVKNFGGYFKGSTGDLPGSQTTGVYGFAQGSGACYGVVGEVKNVTNPYNMYGPKWAGFFKGDVYTTSTQYFSSDERLKTGIKNEESVMEKLLKLVPVSYTFDTKKQIELGMPSNLQHGLIAQRVQEIYPELVKNVVFPKAINAPKEEKAQEYLAVNYTSMIPLLIQGLKEQQAEINELKEILKSKTVEVKSIIEKSGNSNLLNANEYKMLQNTPNPFRSETTIQYSLPKNVNNAKIAVFDLNGTLKIQFNNLSGVSKVVINGNSLPAGMYIYSLIVDGNEVLSKKMILTK